MLEYTINCANFEQVYNFLNENDNAFNPAFSLNNNLFNYANKLIKNATLFEAWLGNNLAGLLAAYYNNNKLTIYVPYICVSQKIKGLGVGQNLFNILMSDLNEYESIELEVRKNNIKAISFYKKMGFIQYDETIEKIKLNKLL